MDLLLFTDVIANAHLKQTPTANLLWHSLPASFSFYSQKSHWLSYQYDLRCLLSSRRIEPCLEIETQPDKQQLYLCFRANPIEKKDLMTFCNLSRIIAKVAKAAKVPKSEKFTLAILTTVYIRFTQAGKSVSQMR